MRNPGSPYFTGVRGTSPPLRFSEKPAYDHMLDHNGECGIIAAQTQNFIFPGVAQLVGRQLWELEAARSNRATRTKNAAQTAEKPQGSTLCGFVAQSYSN